MTDPRIEYGLQVEPRVTGPYSVQPAKRDGLAVTEANSAITYKALIAINNARTRNVNPEIIMSP